MRRILLVAAVLALPVGADQRLRPSEWGWGPTSREECVRPGPTHRSAPTYGIGRRDQAVSSPVTPVRERAYRANNLGVALLEQFKHDAAAQSFRQALQIDPALTIARLNLAIALFYGGHTADAVRE